MWSRAGVPETAHACVGGGPPGAGGCGGVRARTLSMPSIWVPLRKALRRGKPEPADSGAQRVALIPISTSVSRVARLIANAAPMFSRIVWSTSQMRPGRGG